jgi:hypothetical protein
MFYQLHLGLSNDLLQFMSSDQNYVSIVFPLRSACTIYPMLINVITLILLAEKLIMWYSPIPLSGNVNLCPYEMPRFNIMKYMKLWNQR